MPLVEEAVAGTDLFVVDVKCSASNEIEVVLDSLSEPITIDRCAAVSRAIEGKLDRDAEDFQLTVASAGLSEPLRLLPQYRKHLGKEVEVVFRDGRKLKGELAEADESTLTLRYEKKVEVEGRKRKQLQTFTEQYSLEDIKTTRLEVKFK